jgi:hypothetical protein
MREHPTKRPTLLRGFAGMHSVHAALIALVSLGAALPAAHWAPVPTAVQAGAQPSDADDAGEEDKDRNQNQDRDSDQDQDRDVSDVTKLCVASELDQEDFLAPELILMLRRGPQPRFKRAEVGASQGQAALQTPTKPPRAVHARICRLML